MNRKQKHQEDEKKYGNIPIDYNERLNWMVDEYHLSPAKMEEILLSIYLEMGGNHE